MALNIANVLRAELSKDERTRVRRKATHNLEAYEVYLRGRDRFYRFTEEGFRRSLVDFDAATLLDPDFALAWTAIAETHVESCSWAIAQGANLSRPITSPISTPAWAKSTLLSAGSSVLLSSARAPSMESKARSFQQPARPSLLRRMNLA